MSEFPTDYTEISDVSLNDETNNQRVTSENDLPKTDQNRIESLDYTYLKKETESLVSTGNEIMTNDEKIRNAIKKAVTYQRATDKFFKKRKALINILQECRRNEGFLSEKLLETVKFTLMSQLGSSYHGMKKYLQFEILKSRQPILVMDPTVPPPNFRPPAMFSEPPPQFRPVPPPQTFEVSVSQSPISYRVPPPFLYPPPQPPNSFSNPSSSTVSLQNVTSTSTTSVIEPDHYMLPPPPMPPKTTSSQELTEILLKLPPMIEFSNSEIPSTKPAIPALLEVDLSGFQLNSERSSSGKVGVNLTGVFVGNKVSTSWRTPSHCKNSKKSRRPQQFKSRKSDLLS